MKVKFKNLFFLCCCLIISGMLGAQSKDIFKGKIIDFIVSAPLEDTYIHNLSTGATCFTNSNGDFSIRVKASDTIMITRVGYNPEILILTDSLMQTNERVYIRLLMKTILLRNINIYAIKPYPLFLKDIAKDDQPYLDIPGIKITETDKVNAEYKNQEGFGNILRNTPLAHPFTFLYEQFSRKARLNRMYADLMNHQDETMKLVNKYNPEIVKQITGLKDNELEEFMVYCSFTYYTLIVSSEQEIRDMIYSKYQLYQKENAAKE